MSTDVIEKLGKSTVQHGPFNDRAYLIHLDQADCPGIVPELVSLARRHGYSKIVGKTPQLLATHFEQQGFGVEATIPDYFGEGEDACYMAKFFTAERSRERKPGLVEDVLAAARAKAPASAAAAAVADGYEMCVMEEKDTPEMARHYSEVFRSYPFAIDDPGFLASTMENVRYYAMKKEGRLAALASADMDGHAKSVEMTDFATHKDHLGQGLALALLCRMDQDMAAASYRTAFTIARSRSYGMNITFAKAGYQYNGTLINNTNIHGGFESMNIWSKRL